MLQIPGAQSRGTQKRDGQRTEVKAQSSRAGRGAAAGEPRIRSEGEGVLCGDSHAKDWQRGPKEAYGSPTTEGASSSRYRGLLCAKATLFTFYASSFSTLLPGNDGTITMVTAMAPEGPEYFLFRVGI